MRLSMTLAMTIPAEPAIFRSTLLFGETIVVATNLLCLDLKTRRWAQTRARIWFIPGAIVLPLDEIIESGYVFHFKSLSRFAARANLQLCAGNFKYCPTLRLQTETFFHVEDLQAFC
jgi:hypothetical protein